MYVNNHESRCHFLYVCNELLYSLGVYSCWLITSYRLNREVADEVSWIKEKGLEVVIMDCPSTLVFEKPQINGMVFGIVSEVWDNIMRTITPLGKKPFYPEGWDAMYHQWKVGKVRTKDLIAWSGMSAGTLNVRLQAYGPIAEGTTEIMPLRRKSERYEYL